MAVGTIIHACCVNDDFHTWFTEINNILFCTEIRCFFNINVFTDYVDYEFCRSMLTSILSNRITVFLLLEKVELVFELLCEALINTEFVCLSDREAYRIDTVRIRKLRGCVPRSLRYCTVRTLSSNRNKGKTRARCHKNFDLKSSELFKIYTSPHSHLSMGFRYLYLAPFFALSSTTFWTHSSFLVAISFLGPLFPFLSI